MSFPRVTLTQSRDPLEKSRVYQLAKELLPDSFADAERLVKNEITRRVAGQLYFAIASIAAQMAEGYSRYSGKDRARYFEYSLGSTRESMVWYEASKPVIGVDTAEDRQTRLEEIRRMLLAIIPREREKTLKKRK